jgi:hypothetical protein
VLLLMMMMVVVVVVAVVMVMVVMAAYVTWRQHATVLTPFPNHIQHMLSVGFCW